MFLIRKGVVRFRMMVEVLGSKNISVIIDVFTDVVVGTYVNVHLNFCFLYKEGVKFIFLVKGIKEGLAWWSFEEMVVDFKIFLYLMEK